MFHSFFLVGTGGFLGAIARYCVSLFVKRFATTPFPLATLIVNFVGCVAIGYLVEKGKDHPQAGALLLFFGVGVLGAFTTFSTFSLETIQLFREGRITYSFLNILANFSLCFLGVVTSLWIANKTP